MLTNKTAHHAGNGRIDANWNCRK